MNLINELNKLFERGNISQDPLVKAFKSGFRGGGARRSDPDKIVKDDKVDARELHASIDEYIAACIKYKKAKPNDNHDKVNAAIRWVNDLKSVKNPTVDQANKFREMNKKLLASMGIK